MGQSRYQGTPIRLAPRDVLPRPWAFVRHVNKYCVVFGRRSLAAAMRHQVEPSRSDGLFAAGALWVGGHYFFLPLPRYLGHHSPRLPLWGSRLSAISLSRPAAHVSPTTGALLRALSGRLAFCDRKTHQNAGNGHGLQR